MALSREEIENIGKLAAQRQLSSSCMDIAADIESVHSDAIDRLHTLIYNYGVAKSRQGENAPAVEEKKAGLLKSIENAQNVVQQSIIETGYAAPENIKHITDRLGKVYQLVKEGKLYDAMAVVEILSHNLFVLMLRTVVACECGKIQESIKSSADVG